MVVAVIIFFGCIVSPPGLMDDVDAVHGQIARNMVQSGDWVIAHLDGVAYMEKAPMPYWLIAICYMLMGVHDWVGVFPRPWRLCCCVLSLRVMERGPLNAAPVFMLDLRWPHRSDSFFLRAFLFRT